MSQPNILFKPPNQHLGMSLTTIEMTKDEYDHWKILDDPKTCERCNRKLKMTNIGILGLPSDSKKLIGYCAECIADDSNLPVTKGMKFLVVE